ncbi:MAG: hypothetical protein JO033_28960 [Acidobacteriaceae bacterium]|nr:hypothetical protein [Acidobacteriaceae bacterium]
MSTLSRCSFLCVAMLTTTSFIISGIARADSISFITFAYQGNGTVQLGPGLNPLIGPSTPPDFLTFETDLPTGPNSFLFTLDIAGFHLTNPPDTFDCPSSIPCSVVYGFRMPLLYHVAPGTLNADINGISESYDFRYQTPAPEPSSLAMFIVCGMAFLALRLGPAHGIRRAFHLCLWSRRVT